MASQSNNFDGASVSGGFNLQGNQFHGPVNIGGSHHDDVDNLKTLRLLQTVDPEHVRSRILSTKGKLVKGSYTWIIQDESFLSWLHGADSHLLWIKGGPGKGKTMMTAGLIEALPEQTMGSVALSYFFCQNADTELRKATSIVKGLIFRLAVQERTLIHHLQSRCEAGGDDLLSGPYALSALAGILKDMLRDFRGEKICLVVDALDECHDPEFSLLLDLIADRNSAPFGKVKWLVTSRPLPEIEKKIGPDRVRSRISLEVEKMNVSQGVETFIEETVDQQHMKNWDFKLVEDVRSYLKKNAEGTFLWIALVCEWLQKLSPWEVEEEMTQLAKLQRGLDPFYSRMMQVVQDTRSADLCLQILRVACLAYRPIRLQELGAVTALPRGFQDGGLPNLQNLRTLIEKCGSFLLLHDDIVYFVHQSAKEYFDTGEGSTIFSSGRLHCHTSIARMCLDTLISSLKVHHFPDPASVSDQGPSQDELRSLSKIAYACPYWIHHTVETLSHKPSREGIPNEEKICTLLDLYLVSWIHALGSLKEVATCIIMVKALLERRDFMSPVSIEIMQDSYRFLRRNRHIIEESPDQTYISSLLFAPKTSHIRRKYESVIPRWIKVRAQISETWDACLETLLGHSAVVTRIIFSSDGRLIASDSDDCTVRLWETETGSLRSIHDGCSVLPRRWDSRSWNDDRFFSNDRFGSINELAFSPDDNILASGSDDGTLYLWETATGSLYKKLETRTSSRVRQLVFAPTSQVLVSSFWHGSVSFWSVPTPATGSYFDVQHPSSPRSMVFSHDCKLIALAFERGFEIRNVETGKVVMEYHFSIVSVQFAPNSSLLAFASSYSISLWHPGTKNSFEELYNLDSHDGSINTVKFSPDGNLLASLSDHGRVTIWEVSTGDRLHALFDAGHRLYEATFSPDSRMVVTPSTRGAKAWDTTTGAEISRLQISQLETVEDSFLSAIAYSKDVSLFAQAIGHKIMIWEVTTGVLRGSLEGHSDKIRHLEFSPAGDILASASDDNTIKLWNLEVLTSHEVTRYEGHVMAIVLSPDGLLAASVSPRGKIRIWEVVSGLLRPVSIEFEAIEGRPVFSPDNSLLAARSNQVVRFWDTRTGVESYFYLDAWSRISCFAFSRNSRFFGFGHGDNVARIVETRTGSFEDISKSFHQFGQLIYGSPNGKYFIAHILLIQHPDHRGVTGTGLWERQGRGRQPTLKCNLGEIEEVATFSRDSSLFAAVYKTQWIGIWETETGCLHKTLQNPVRCAYVIAFSQDNNMIAYTSGAEDTLCILELNTGLVRTLSFAGANRAKMVTFSLGAGIIGAASNVSFIRMRKITSGSFVADLKRHQSQIKDVTFSPDERVLAAGYEDGIIQIWETDRYTLAKTIGTTQSIQKFSFDSKSMYIWTGVQGCFINDHLFRCTEDVTDDEPIASVEHNWVLFKGKRVLWLPP